MKPIKFPEAQRELLKPSSMTDEECSSLHIYQDGDACLSCWHAGWRERLSMLFFGRVWLWVHYGSTQPPVALSVTRTPFVRAVAWVSKRNL